ncbi:peptide transporter family 1-like isoform X2, partial [Aphis craccivora]
ISYLLVRVNSNTRILNRVDTHNNNLIKEKFGNQNFYLITRNKFAIEFILIDRTFDFVYNITLTSAEQYSSTLCIMNYPIDIVYFKIENH